MNHIQDIKNFGAIIEDLSIKIFCIDWFILVAPVFHLDFISLDS